MLTAGLYHTLRVNRISDFGLYLADEEGNEVLLPNRYVSRGNRIDDMIDVFLYHDSEDRLVATTERPYATVGEVAALRVIDKTVHGAFLDWGLEAKDLFLPKRNIQGRLELGEPSIVWLYTDNVSGRAVATNFLNGFIHNAELNLKPRQEVEILVASENPLGYRAVIENRFWGMLYRNQIFQPIAVGDRLRAFVTKLSEDGRVDLSIQQQGYDEVKRSAERLVALMQERGGSILLSDHSSPEEIYEMTQMSKKVFKRAIGYLLKQEKIALEQSRTRLKSKYK